MQLFISSFGAYIRKTEDCFEIKVDDVKKKIASNKVNSILISTAATISTDAIKLSIDKNIDIVFLDKFGDPYGRIWHPKLGSTTLIRRKQLEIAETEKGLRLACQWIKQKIDNQIDHFKLLRKTRTKKSAEITRYMKNLKSIASGIDNLSGTLEKQRGTIMGIEGSSARIYFNGLCSLMPKKWRFEGRSRNPAKDAFNAYLNYGYGVLYSQVEKACIIAGLDPYVGLLHTDHYNKKSLVFDLIENYRVWIEIIVIQLFAKRKVKEDTLSHIPGGFNLNKKGKQILLENMNNFMEQKIRHNHRNVKRLNIIQLDCHRLANRLIED